MEIGNAKSAGCCAIFCSAKSEAESLHAADKGSAWKTLLCAALPRSKHALNKSTCRPEGANPKPHIWGKGAPKTQSTGVYLGPALAGLGGDLHRVLSGGGEAVKDGGLVREDAVVRVGDVLENQREVDREVADEVV